MEESYLLLAHIFSYDSESCAHLYTVFRPFVNGGGHRTRPVDLDRHDAVLQNASLRDAFERYNVLDRRLYDAAVPIFCNEWRRAVTSNSSCVRALAEASVQNSITGFDGYPPICRGVREDQVPSS